MKKSELKKIIKECLNEAQVGKKGTLQKLGRNLKVGSTYKVEKRHPIYADFPVGTKLKLTSLTTSPGWGEENVEIEWELLTGKHNGDWVSNKGARSSIMKTGKFVKEI